MMEDPAKRRFREMQYENYHNSDNKPDPVINPKRRNKNKNKNRPSYQELEKENQELRELVEVCIDIPNNMVCGDSEIEYKTHLRYMKCMEKIKEKLKEIGGE